MGNSRTLLKSRLDNMNTLLNNITAQYTDLHLLHICGYSLKATIRLFGIQVSFMTCNLVLHHCKNFEATFRMIQSPNIKKPKKTAKIAVHTFKTSPQTYFNVIQTNLIMKSVASEGFGKIV